MKRVFLLIALSILFGGCAWIQRSGHSVSGGVGGHDIGPGRGTTGVSSGAEEGFGVTGSDLAPR
jgi:hypothetical protein